MLISFCYMITMHSLQFSNLGPLEGHGFARIRFWSIDDNPPPLQTNTSKTFVDLILKPSEDDAKFWPYRYNKTCLLAFIS